MPTFSDLLGIKAADAVEGGAKNATGLLAKLAGNGGHRQDQEDKLYKAAVSQYNREAIKYNDKSNGLEQMVNGIQSNDSTTTGRVFAGLMKSLGFGRFNNFESVKSMPPDQQNAAIRALNSVGVDASKYFSSGNYTDLSLHQMANAAQSIADEIKQGHSVAKQNALAFYGGSSYADPTKLAALSSTLGSPLETRIQVSHDTLNKFQKALSDKNQQRQPAAVDNSSLLEKLTKGAAGLLGVNPQAPAPAQPQQSLGGMGGQPQPQQAAPVAPQPRLPASPSPQAPQPEEGGASLGNASSKSPVKKLQNKALNKTRIIYSDGSQEDLDGLQ